MKKTKPTSPYAICFEDEIHFFTSHDIENGLQASKKIKMFVIEDKFLIESPSIIAIIFALAFNAIIIPNAFNTRNLLIMYSTLYFAFTSSLMFFNFLIKVPILKYGSNEWRKWSRLHAAMHMAINAYNKKGSNPTFEEIRNSSFITKSCSSMCSIRDIICSTMFLVISVILKEYTILTILFFLVISYVSNLLNKIGLFNQFQRLIISKPTDLEIKIISDTLEIYEQIYKQYGYVIVN